MESVAILAVAALVCIGAGVFIIWRRDSVARWNQSNIRRTLGQRVGDYVSHADGRTFVSVGVIAILVGLGAVLTAVRIILAS